MNPPPVTTAMHSGKAAPDQKYAARIKAVRPRPIAVNAGPNQSPATA